MAVRLFFDENTELKIQNTKQNTTQHNTNHQDTTRHNNIIFSAIISFAITFKIKFTMIQRSPILLTYVLIALVSAVTCFSPHMNTVRTTRTSASKTTLYMSDQEGASDAPPTPAVRCPDCDKCDGSGRILGGIPLILPWWPIKPYRPCPNFIANGGQYSRIGQPLDEIAFGRGGPINDDEDDVF